MTAVLCEGSLDADDSTAAGDLPPTVKSIKWAYSTRSIYGWGDTGTDQKSTAGWLAALPVFEPHWQVYIPSLLRTMLPFAAPGSALFGDLLACLLNLTRQEVNVPICSSRPQGLVEVRSVWKYTGV